MKNETKNKKNEKAFALVLTLTVLFLLGLKNVRATIDYNCSQFEGDDKKKCQKREDQANAYEKIIELKNKQGSTLTNQIQQINVEETKNGVLIEETRNKLSVLYEQIKKLENDILEKEKSFEYQKKILTALMQTYYDYDQQGVLELVLAGKDLSSVLNQTDYLNQSETKVGELLFEIQETKNILLKDKKELDEKRDEQEKLKKDLEDRNLDLQYSEDKKQTLLGQTQKEREKYEKLLADIENEISQLEAGKAGETDFSNLPPSKKGYFTYPVNPVKISQGYGKTSFSGHYASGKHNGVDFSIKYSNVFATKGGKILAVGNNGKYAYGKWIAVDHGNGLVTLYGHLSKQSVSKGESVKEGEVIGISGNTGYSTGPHLHFSVFAKSSFETTESKYVKGLMIPIGATVNPMNYF